MVGEILTVNSIVYGGAGIAAGYALGWMLKKLMMLLFKVALIIVVFFFTALVYFESIHVISINERALDHLLNASYYAVNEAITKYGIDNPSQFIITSLGLPMVSGLAIGLILGWLKG